MLCTIEKDSNAPEEFLSIENWNKDVAVAKVNILSFLNNFMKGQIPGDYHLKKGLDLRNFKQLYYYFTDDELSPMTQSRSMKRQVEWLCGRIALKELLSREALDNTDLKDIIIEYNAQGKPQVRGNESIGVTISHSHEFALAAMHRRHSKRIGIDAEQIDELNIEAILPVICSKNERKMMVNETPTEVLKVFTLKEAFLKYKGTGFHETISDVMVRGANIIYKSLLVTDIVTEYRFFNNYITSLIYEK